MKSEHPELDAMQHAYRAAVEEWIGAIHKEEALASVAHSLAQVDRWEGAHDDEEAARDKVKDAKREYEAALREKFFDF
jgi:hypothetical protein